MTSQSNDSATESVPSEHGGQRLCKTIVELHTRQEQLFFTKRSVRAHSLLCSSWTTLASRNKNVSDWRHDTHVSVWRHTQLTRWRRQDCCQARVLPVDVDGTVVKHVSHLLTSTGLLSSTCLTRSRSCDSTASNNAVNKIIWWRVTSDVTPWAEPAGVDVFEAHMTIARVHWHFITRTSGRNEVWKRLYSGLGCSAKETKFHELPVYMLVLSMVPPTRHRVPCKSCTVRFFLSLLSDFLLPENDN